MSNDPLIAAITPKTDWYVVLRPFHGEGDALLIRGEVVNTKEWIRPERLADLRYIAPMPHGVDVPEPNDDGRRLIVLDEEQLEVVPETKQPAKAEERPVPTAAGRKQRK